ncbi:nucleotidyltransferase domain-containing protein [Nonomuraea sp. NPDC049625]|uniref:nucleotidyltransferase domain-containing protein n=1 Tax=Nonomuraea sp. NPDC049625 TaxID=3155775 RepID=UPI0034379694
MGVDEAFDDFQKTVDADRDQVTLARDRRDTFKKAFGAERGVTEVFGSGSLRRSTQLKPVHDVDLVIVYDQEDHPSWGQPGDSAEDALDYVRQRVNVLLGGTNGTVEQLVRLARWRNHAVKCFIDPPEDPEAFTVDTMPALRQSDGTLLIPEALNKQWVVADPEDLIRRVAEHQSDWQYFRPMVRVLKQWRHSVPVEGKIKSLVMEVLALECMPRAGSRSAALRAFFTAAAVRVNWDLADPAGHCGLIQPDLDRAGLRTALEAASETATRACEAAANGDTDDALRAWQEIFGSTFPAPEGKKASPWGTGPALITPRPVKDAPQG